MSKILNSSKKSKDKVKIPNKSKILKKSPQKKLSPDYLSKTYKVTRANSKQTKNQFQSNWENILEDYNEFLTVSEIAEIKQYKNIYFLGKIKERKNKKLFHSNKKSQRSAIQEGFPQNNTEGMVTPQLT